MPQQSPTASTHGQPAPPFVLSPGRETTPAQPHINQPSGNSGTATERVTKAADRPPGPPARCAQSRHEEQAGENTRNPAREIPPPSRSDLPAFFEMEAQQ